jgi:hypothetical protein
MVQGVGIFGIETPKDVFSFGNADFSQAFFSWMPKRLLSGVLP